MPKTLFVRADANPIIGSGHLMRCIALGQAWKNKGGNVIFITACENTILLKRLVFEGFRLIHLKSVYPDKSDCETTLSLLPGKANVWVVIDGYHFTSSYQKMIKDRGHLVMVIDDMAHLDHYYSQVLLNQNIYASQLNYSCESDTDLLLGNQYALLRNEFRVWQKRMRQFPVVARKLLISLGGSDSKNVTLKVVNALSMVNIKNLDVKIVAGASNQHIECLKNASDRAACSIEIFQHVHNMPELLDWADFAVLAGGSTNLEILFMCVPYIAIITAENQRRNVNKLSSLNATINLGWHENLEEKYLAQVLYRLLSTKSLREKMSYNCFNMVDGIGAERVVSKLMSYNY